MVSILLVLLLQDGREFLESPRLLFLRYLARHQRSNGSWGERPPTCTCADEKKEIPCDPEKAAGLLLLLGDEDPGKRDSAQKELRVMGGSALPYLRRGMRDRDPEIRARCAVLSREFGHEAQGGTDTELTGLALLAFMDAGHSHLSKLELDGIGIGGVVKNGLKWLIAREDLSLASGPGDPAGNAIAALALSDAYGMTGTPFLRDSAQKGIDRIIIAPLEETRQVVWVALALKSAEMSGLVCPKKYWERVLEAFEGREGEKAIAGYPVVSLCLRNNKRKARGAEVQWLDPVVLEPETLYMATEAVLRFDGPQGMLWRPWMAITRITLAARQHTQQGECERGSWDGQGFRGRLQATALGGMTSLLQYR